MNMLWKMVMAAIFVVFPLTVYAENEEEEFKHHKTTMIKDMEEKIRCFRKAANWDDIENCHHEIEIREKQRRLEELEEEQLRLREELETIHNKDR